MMILRLLSKKEGLYKPFSMQGLKDKSGVYKICVKKQPFFQLRLFSKFRDLCRLYVTLHNFIPKGQNVVAILYDCAIRRLASV